MDGSFETSTSGQPGSRPPPRKRNRQALSCTVCRDRKIKCDRNVPCSQCVKRDDQAKCRIEQKPKVDHAKPLRAEQQQQSVSQQPTTTTTASSAHPQSASSPLDLASRASENRSSGRHPHGPLSPGMLAYDQFSAALSTNSSLYSSASPPPAEVDAIKARLALLESVLGQMSPASMSNLTLAALNSTPPSSTTMTSPLPPASQPTSFASRLPRGSNGSSPVDHFDGAPRSDTTRSTSLGAHSHSPSSQQRTESDSEEEPDWTSMPSSEAQRASPNDSQNVFSSRYFESIRDVDSMSRKELDCDTEEAVVVLESLAMAGSGKQPPRGGPRPKTAAAAAAAAAAADQCQQDCEEVRVGFERCLLQDRQHDFMAEVNEGCPVARDAAKTASAWPGFANASAADPCDASIAAAAAGPSSSSLTTLSPLNATAFGPPRPEGQGQAHAPGANAPGIGNPQCACGPNTSETRNSDGGPASDMPANVCADVTGRESQLFKKACMSSCNNEGLLRPKSGPESLLGWGLGWAFAAGDTKLREDLKRAKDEGRTFAVTERTEREAVLQVVIEALPGKEVVNQLVEVFESRVRYLCGHIVHIPCLRREIEAFYALESTEKRARVVNHVDAGWLAMLLSVLALGLQFYPCHPKKGWVSASHLFDGGKTVLLWHSASKACLTLAGYLHSTSISVLQSILLNMMLVSGSWIGGMAGTNETDQIAAQASLVRVAISNAQEMGLHRLGDLDKQGTPQDPPSKVIRREIAKRVWWALVMKDWIMAASGCRKDYVIDRDRFNTPMPGNYNDDDLLVSPLPSPRPREEYTEMSYVLVNLEFGLACKEDFDIRNRREMLAATTGGDRRLTCVEARGLDQLYRSVLEKAPSFFCVGSEEAISGRITCVEVQRWLLQQGVFSKLLRIHRLTLSSRQESRTNCVLLARSILDMQKKIRSRCTVIDRLWANLMQSFSAAVVLALHLLHSRPQADHRLAVRSEIVEAINALKQIDNNSNANLKCIRVIEALLAEEERWQAGNAVLASNSCSNGRDATSASTTAKPTHLSQKRKWQNDPRAQGEDGDGSRNGGRRKNLLSLAQKVAAATMGGNETPRSADHQAAANETSSKRAATQEAVHAGKHGDHFATMPYAPPSTLASAIGDVPALSLGTMMLPNSGSSPIPYFADSASGLDGFNFQFPVLPYTSQQQHLVYDFSSNPQSNGINSGGGVAVGNGATAAGVDPFRHVAAPVAAPNGVDFFLNNPHTPPDGQSFDLAAFLEQCENSPGSLSEGSTAPGNQRSFTHTSDTSGYDKSRSTSSDDVSPATSSPEQTVESKPERGSGPTASPAATAPFEPATNMDSFWNWLLTQGDGGAATTTITTAQPAATANTDTLSQAQPQLPDASASVNASSSAQTFKTGLTPYAVAMEDSLPFPSSSSAGNVMPSAAAAVAPTSSGHGGMMTSQPASASVAPALAPPTSSAVGYPLFQVGTPFNVESSSVSDPTQQPGTKASSAQSPSPSAGGLGNFGTPSAEVGLDSFLSAPLYDFTDYALAWTSSNPNAAINTAPGQGPISDP